MALTAVRITSKVDGYRRAGVLHPSKPTTYPPNRFTKKQLALLQQDRLLTVELIEEPDPPAPPPDTEAPKDARKRKGASKATAPAGNGTDSDGAAQGEG